VTGTAGIAAAVAIGLTVASSGPETVRTGPGVAKAGQAGHTTQRVHAGPRGGGLVTSERPFGTLTGTSAQAYLVTLATRVAQVTPATGRYWCQSVITAQLDPIGRGGQELTPAGQGEKHSLVSDYRYSIFARQVQDVCFEYSGTSSRNVGGDLQNLGAEPAIGTDAAAWRMDGSPAWPGARGTGMGS
jgi:hypothetical protein